MSDTGGNGANGAGGGQGPDFAEIRKIIAEFPAPDVEAVLATREREAVLTKPQGSLGRLEEITEWVAAWQGRHPPNVTHARIAVFAGNHGVAAKGVSAYPPEVTKQMVQNFVAGGAAVNQLTEMADADLRVYEMALDAPTADFTEGPALGEDDCAKAIAYGMMSVEAGVELMALGEMGIANTTAAAAICHALYGGRAEDWVGPGTGVSGDAYAAKVAAVEAAVATNAGLLDDPCRCSAQWVVMRLRPSRGRSSRPGLPGFRCCLMAIRARRRRLCCTPSTNTQSIIAWSGIYRLNRPTGCCAINSIRCPCWRSPCGWAKARARHWRSRSSVPHWPATRAWRVSKAPGSVAGRTEPEGLAGPEMSGRI